jgi:hypothetical protein
MLKNILIKCAEMLNRNDMVKILKTQTDVSKIVDESLQADIYRLINYFNFSTTTLFENYFELSRAETLTSDSNNIIQYHNFSFTPIKILSIIDSLGNENAATVLSAHILTNKPKSKYKITYCYVPAELKNLSDELEPFHERLSKIICFSVVSEFFACKNMYDQSNFWKNRFLFEVFKLKTKKERRLKSTFSL